MLQFDFNDMVMFSCMYDGTVLLVDDSFNFFSSEKLICDALV